MENLQRFRKVLDVAEELSKNKGSKFTDLIKEYLGISIVLGDYDEVIQLSSDDIDSLTVEDIVKNLENISKERERIDNENREKLKKLRELPEVKEYINLASRY